MGAIVCRHCRFAHEGPCKPGIAKPDGSGVEIQGHVAVLRCASCAAMAAKIAVLEQQLVRLSNKADSNKSNGFDKKAYQREYMRKRRAQKAEN